MRSAQATIPQAVTWPANGGSTPKQHPTHSKSTHPPPRFAGFYKAWLSGGFSEKVLKRLRELDDQVDGHMRFWITGGWRECVGWVTCVGVTGASSASGASCLSESWWMGAHAPGPHHTVTLRLVLFAWLVCTVVCTVRCAIPESWATGGAQACTLWGRATSQSTQHDLPHYRPAFQVKLSMIHRIITPLSSSS